MAELTFQKVSTGGNDFIVLFGEHAALIPTKDTPRVQWIRALCHRRFGIGADGVMLILDNRVSHFDPDGSESFCVNGSIALAFLSAAGFPVPKLFSLAEVPVSIRPSRNHPAVRFRPPLVQLQDMKADGIPGRYVHIGNPHFLVNWQWEYPSDILEQGRTLAHLNVFPEGANVSFWYETPEGIRIATYERGVEDVTLSCGSACAALALSLGRSGSWTMIPPSHCAIQVTIDGPSGHLILSTEVIHAFEGVTHTLLLDHPLC